MRLRINSWAGGKMPKRSKERSLIEFQKEFPDNEACAKHIAEQRDGQVDLFVLSAGIRKPGIFPRSTCSTV
jgi:hypothetical protein